MAGRLLARITSGLIGGAPRVYLHIGAMKTGTTYLQDLLGTNRERLRAAGYLFPGERFSDQSHAVREVLFTQDDDELAEQTRGKWEQLLGEVREHRGKASIISMEFLSFADSERATRVIESFAGMEVHVILTVRDAQRAIPAQWQTATRNGSKVPYPQFVRGVRHVLKGEHSPQGRGSHLFERTQGVPRMLGVWAPLVGSRRTHVITLPPSGSDPSLLWRRFAKVIGVRPRVATELPDAANPSLGHPSSELLRLINKELGPVSQIDHWTVIKGPLARQILGPRSDLEPAVRLHRSGIALARRWNEVVRRAIKDQGVHLVGSYDDLPVGPPPEGLPEALHKPDQDELLAAAATAYEGLVDLREEFCTRAGLDVPPRPEEPDWLRSPEPVDAAVADITEVIRQCMGLRHQFPDPEDESLRAESFDPAEDVT